MFEVASPLIETALQDAFSDIDLGDSSSIVKVDKMVSASIQGILKDQFEILKVNIMLLNKYSIIYELKP